MTLSGAIELPFSRDSVIRVLSYGASPETSPYNHNQIAEWCNRFCYHYRNIDTKQAMEELLSVVFDVDVQWELYLVNIYSIDELRSKSFDDETMPLHWFRDWLKEVEN